MVGLSKSPLHGMRLTLLLFGTETSVAQYGGNVYGT